MTQEEHDAAVVAFIRARGVTRCPTACAVPTQASVAEPDRLALRRRDDHLEEIREERLRHAASRGFGIAATLAARSPVHYDHLEEIREERLRHAASRGFGIAATLAARSPVH